jgi:deazaflavin-dependent oxidoreductase (nitroreductase family)
MSDAENTPTATGAPPPRWVLRAFTGIHMVLHRLSGGRLFNTLAGDEVCFVTMKGAKSGRSLTVPLMYVPYQEGLLLVASQGGAPKNPAWYFNLVKHPDIEINYRGKHMALRARLATRNPICGLFVINTMRLTRSTERAPSGTSPFSFASRSDPNPCPAPGEVARTPTHLR